MVFFEILSPKFKSKPFDVTKVNYWMPVDQYIGGIEHAIYTCYIQDSLCVP